MVFFFGSFSFMPNLYQNKYSTVFKNLVFLLYTFLLWKQMEKESSAGSSLFIHYWIRCSISFSFTIFLLESDLLEVMEEISWIVELLRTFLLFYLNKKIRSRWKPNKNSALVKLKTFHFIRQFSIFQGNSSWNAISFFILTREQDFLVSLFLNFWLPNLSLF